MKYLLYFLISLSFSACVNNNPEVTFIAIKTHDFLRDIPVYTDDSLHSFYMIRPARSLEGTTRGVLGQYRLSAESSMYDFVEILNTRIKTRKELQKI